jgi:hypothetical protein
MDDYTNNFPIGFYREFLEQIELLGIETITYKDIFQHSDDWDYKSFYPNEFKFWKKNRNKNKRYLLIQHDVDLHPHLTEEVVKLEQEFGVRSNIFLFAQRWTIATPNPQYPVNHSFFQKAESIGFVIGYHQNAFQRSGFDLEKAQGVYLEDVNTLRALYNIEFVVPHGGRGLEIDGKKYLNLDIDIPESLQNNLRWVYNKYGLKFSRRVSDGGLRKCTDKNRLQQLDLVNTFLPSIKLGERAFLLTHPQRWGDQVDPSKTPLLSNMPWYQKVCDRYGVPIDTRKVH